MYAYKFGKIYYSVVPKQLWQIATVFSTLYLCNVVNCYHFTVKISNQCLYIKINSNVCLFLLLYVDDVLLVSSSMKSMDGWL